MSIRLRLKRRRKVYAAAIRGCREGRDQNEARVIAERICREEYGFIETIIATLIFKLLIYIIPMIWNWIREGRSDSDIESLLEADGTMLVEFGDMSDEDDGTDSIEVEPS